MIILYIYIDILCTYFIGDKYIYFKNEHQIMILKKFYSDIIKFELFLEKKILYNIINFSNCSNLLIENKTF
jgi:hypothetical protein